MSTTTPNTLVTADEFLALPDDGMERMLIQGIVWEKPMTRRSRWHARTEAKIAQVLGNWLDGQPEPKGDIYSGEVGFRLEENPATVVGIDVAYVSTELANQESSETSLLVGVPVLAVEILSPSDKQNEINTKIDLYMDAGVQLIWIVDPHFKTVVVHSPNNQPELFAGEEVISNESSLPGFSTTAKSLFTR